MLVGGSQQEELTLSRVVMKHRREMTLQLTLLITDTLGAGSREENIRSKRTQRWKVRHSLSSGHL